MDYLDIFMVKPLFNPLIIEIIVKIKPDLIFGFLYYGGGGENRTRVQRTIDKKYYERSLCFIIHII